MKVMHVEVFNKDLYGIPNGQDDGTWPNVMIHIGTTVKLHGSIL